MADEEITSSTLELDEIKKKLSGIVLENEQNKQFTDNIKSIESLMGLVNGYVDNLINDKNSLEAYYAKLQLLKKRGFKVANAIARLKYQIEITQTSIDNLSSQKKNRLILLKNDILELTKTVLDYRIVIDDKEDGVVKQLREDLSVYDHVDERISVADIMKLTITSLSHMTDLQEDIYKFDPQIQEAKQYRERNFDLGDLVETLELQKQTTIEKHSMYSGFYVSVSAKHYDRTVKYINQLAIEADRVKNEAETTKATEDHTSVTDATTNDNASDPHVSSPELPSAADPSGVEPSSTD